MQVILNRTSQSHTSRINSFFVYFLLFIFCVNERVQAAENAFFNHCSNMTVSSKYQIAYKGWRHKLLCSLFLEDDTIYDDYQNDPEQAIACYIWNMNGTLLYQHNTTYWALEEDDRERNIGYLLPSDNLYTHFTLNLIVSENEKCFTLNIQLNLTNLRQETCQDFEKNIFKSPSFPTQLNKRQTLHCELDPSTYPKLYAEHNISYRWQRNCTDFPLNNSSHVGPKVLLIPPVTYEDAGVYTCSVTHNRATRYIAVYEICIVQPLSFISPTLSCNKETLRRNIGEEAVFKCHGNFGFGQITQTDFRFNWNKVTNGSGSSSSSGKGICSNVPVSNVYGATCYFKIEKKPCLLHVASEAERENMEAIVPVWLKISNIRSEDYGVYSISVGTNVEDGKIAVKEVKLESNPLPSLITQAQLAGVLIGILCVLLVLLLIALYHRIYIKVYYKRYFEGFIADDKMYGAFFIYHFSHDMSSSSMKYVNLSISVVREQLKKMKYNVLDEMRDGDSGQNRAECIQTSIEQSHRVIILLTIEFIKDEWSMLALQKGFNEMIRAKSKLIFILFPGIKEYLAQHSKTDNTCLMIKRAVQNNYAIQWTGLNENPKNHFKLELENAMPKLELQVSPSDSSKSSCKVETSNNMKQKEFVFC